MKTIATDQSPAAVRVSGITWAEARHLLAKHGPNIAVPHEVPAWWRVLARSFNNPFNYVLLFLSVVSYLTDDLEATMVMAFMITSATVLRFSQEFRSLVKADSLRKLVRNKCSVLRRGEEFEQRRPDPLDARFSEILVEELVPGDLVRLSAGDMIPADVLLLESRDLFASQSVLTGEAMPVEKTPAPAGVATSGGGLRSEFDAPEICFMGSSVVSGTATALVLATGPRTQMGMVGAQLVERRPITSFGS